MRKLFLIVLLMLSIVACRNGGESENNNVDETSGVQQVEAVEDSPRIENTPVPPTATSLPATNTPAPELTPEHIDSVPPRLIHIIQPGDTLSELAVQYSTTVDAISDANRHYNFDLIYAGDWIYIPDCPPEDHIYVGSLSLVEESESGNAKATSEP